MRSVKAWGTRGSSGLVFAIAGLVAIGAVAQEESPLPEGDITADISTKFISTYRDGSWVPVDVTVRNNKADIRGWLEVTVDTPNGAASPVYRIAAESPKNSRKRFRVYCRLIGASGIRAMLFNGRRPALDLPATVTLLPIDSQDLVGLILDDEPADYAFIYSAIQEQATGRGYHRDEIRTAELPQLPDYPQCYDAYSIVVLGQIDPGQVGARQRELLQRYVEQGGVAVICTGENAGRFRGTWVEAFAGVAVGAQTTLDEAALAESVFPPAGRTGARSGRDVLLSELSPQAGDVQVWGRAPILATRRPLGRGHVVMIALDAKGKAMQECAGYIRLWSDLALARAERARPNYDSAAALAAQMMPAATGIRVYPWTSVLTYLLLYFFIGIVGNWLFWSWMKRREMAWVCMVIFSLCFTAYALIYGTAGRAKSTELAQLEVLHVPEGGGIANLHGIVGIMSARTSRYDFRLTNQYALLSDPWNMWNQPYMRGPGGFMSSSNKFNFTYAQPPRVDDLRVGASVMRVFEVESDAGAPGGVDGELVWDATGIHGALTNNTGLTITQPFLLIEGRRVALAGAGDSWEVSIPPERLARPDSISLDTDMNYYYYGRQVDPYGLQQRMVDTLIASREGADSIDPRLGPFFCGWTTEKALGSIALDEPAVERISRTLVLADIRVARRDSPVPEIYPLETLVGGTRGFSRNPYSNNIRDRMANLGTGSPLTLEFPIPPMLLAESKAILLVDLYWIAGEGLVAPLLAPTQAAANWAAAHAPEERVETGRSDPCNVSTYRIEDWRQYYEPDKGWIEFTIQCAHRDDAPMGWMSILAKPNFLVPRQTPENGDWTPWR